MMDQVLAVRRNPDATYEDVSELVKVVWKMIQDVYGLSGRNYPMSVFGPIGGLMDGACKHSEFYGWAPFKKLWMFRSLVWFILHVMGVKRRPGYNDFLLVRWALLGDEPTALELIERSKREDEIGCTASWALRSLSSQYPEFRERFSCEIPLPQPEHMLKNAPRGSDPEAILDRARATFGGVQ